jgi:ubiquinone/menaquinone biosynthesis C-methylase UbiE
MEGLRGYYYVRVNLDEETLPFPAETFSLVSMLMVLEHVFDVFHAVEEANRVLRPGGHLIVAVPNISYMRITIPLLFGRFPVTSTKDTWDELAWDGYHLHNFTRERLEWLVESFGRLRTVMCKGSGRLWRIRSLLPSLLSGDLILLAQKPQD